MLRARKGKGECPPGDTLAPSEQKVETVEDVVQAPFGWTKRIVSIEVARGQALTISACHFVEYWSYSTTQSRHLDLYTMYDFLDEFFAGLLTIIMGANFYFWVHSRRMRTGMSNAQLRRASFRRAAAFLVIHAVHNLNMYGPDSPRVWDTDVMVYYAVLCLVMPFLWDLPRRRLLLFAAAVLVLAKVAHAWTNPFLVPPSLGPLRSDIACAKVHCPEQFAACAADEPCRGLLRCAADACAAGEIDYSSPATRDFGVGAWCMTQCVREYAPGFSMWDAVPGAPVPAPSAGAWHSLAHCTMGKRCLSPMRYAERVSPLERVLRNVLHQGHFSVIPWLALSVFGYVTAAKLFTGGVTTDDRSLARQRVLGRIAVACVAASVSITALICRVDATYGSHTTLQCFDTLLTPTYESHVGSVGEAFEMAPNPTLLYFLWVIGWTFALLWLCEPLNRTTRLPPRWRWVPWLFSLMNRYLLSIYILQHVVIVRGSYWYSARYAPGGDPEYYWRNPSMPPWAALLAGLLFQALATALMWVLERYCGCFGTLEWFVRRFVAA